MLFAPAIFFAIHVFVLILSLSGHLENSSPVEVLFLFPKRNSSHGDNKMLLSSKPNSLKNVKHSDLCDFALIVRRKDSVSWRQAVFPLLRSPLFTTVHISLHRLVWKMGRSRAFPQGIVKEEGKFQVKEQLFDSLS